MEKPDYGYYNYCLNMMEIAVKNIRENQFICEMYGDHPDYVEHLEKRLSMNAIRKQRFLVITLDDIDIARRKKGDGKENWGTYKIMSTIYKYLTVPGVIVLTAYDYSNLQERCLSFFENENGNKGGFEEATLQFIEKVFPIYSRLFMIMNTATPRKSIIKGKISE